MQDFNPYEAPRESEMMSKHTEGLTITEQVYTAFVVLCTGFVLLGLASFHLIIIPKAKDPGVIYFAVATMWLIFIALSTTIVLNLCYRSLLTIPTIVQCSILCLMIYFSPFGIWGGYLLYRRLQRAKSLEMPPVEIRGTCVMAP